MNTVIELTVARLKPALKPLGLSVVLLDHPDHEEYIKEWRVIDLGDKRYATIGVTNDGHDITFVKTDQGGRLTIRDSLAHAFNESHALVINPPSKLIELENEYLALEIEEALLRDKIKKDTEQLERDKKRLKDVAGRYRDDWSLKKYKQVEIDEEKVRIENYSLVRPVFRDRPQDEGDYKVSRITPKCVFLRRAGGSTKEERIMKDGSNWHLYGFTIKGFDLEATIKRFEEAKKNG